jgi:MFS family permease
MMWPMIFGVAEVVGGQSQEAPAIGPVLGGYLVDKASWRLLAGGTAAMARVSVGFLSVTLTTSLWWIRGLMLLRGSALGMASVPLQAATFATISPQDTGRASSLYSNTRQVGSSIGVAILATTLASRTATNLRRLGLIQPAPREPTQRCSPAIQRSSRRSSSRSWRLASRCSSTTKTRQPVEPPPPSDPKRCLRRGDGRPGGRRHRSNGHRRALHLQHRHRPNPA